MELTSPAAARAVPESPKETFGLWPCRRLRTAASASASHGDELAQPTPCSQPGFSDRVTGATHSPAVRRFRPGNQGFAIAVVGADGWHRGDRPASSNPGRRDLSTRCCHTGLHKAVVRRQPESGRRTSGSAGRRSHWRWPRRLAYARSMRRGRADTRQVGRRAAVHCVDRQLTSGGATERTWTSSGPYGCG